MTLFEKKNISPMLIGVQEAPFDDMKMWPLPVLELVFVGRTTASKLHRLGIFTIGDLAKAGDDLIKAHLKLPGQIIQGYAKGEDLQPYMFTHDANKGYGNSLIAPMGITTKEYVRHLMLSLCETIGARLRNDNVKVGVVSVHITTCEFVYENRQVQLLTAADVTEEFIGRPAKSLTDFGIRRRLYGRSEYILPRCR